MTLVYAWPPVGVTGAEWTEEAPVNASRSIITGRRYVSAHARKRRIASLNVSALANGRSGAGYVEVLKRLLAGGVNLVRLQSYPVYWWLDDQRLRDLRQSVPTFWTDGVDPDVSWSVGAAPLAWFDGRVLTGTAGTDAAGWPVLTVSGLPPSTLIVRPAEFVTLFDTLTATSGQRAQVMTEARSDAGGVAVLRLMAPLTGSGRVNIGTSDTGVFEAVTIPRAAQPVRGDWSYAWSFREVFADEVPGGFEELDPW
jgi:hypothetical protein